ncbi:MAG: SPASM domain-containing protein, partial [Nanoarchaeota archaeon]
IYERYKKSYYGTLKIDNPNNFLRRISNKSVTTGRYDNNIIYKIPCTVGWTFSRIMANGDVAPCCRGVMVATGNINKQNFKDIWNGKKQLMFRKIGVALKKHPKFVEKVGCLKTCDNLMENKENYELVKNLF